MNRALVTGSEGFIGRALCNRLVADGVEVAGLDSQAGFDIRDKTALDAVFSTRKPEVIFHLAAVATTQQASTDPANCYAINVGAVAVILDLALKHGVGRVVLPSTYLPPQEHYAISKRFAGQLCGLHEYRRTTIVYHGNVYGPGDHNLSRIVPSLVTSALQSKIPQVRLGVQRPFVYIDDLVDAYAAFVGATSEARTLVLSADLVDLKSLATMIMSKTKHDGYMNVSFPSVQEPVYEEEVLFDIRIHHKTSLSDGLDKTIEWYRQNYA